MSTLILVRHGQARFGTSNYDRLSPLGIEQSTMLGRWWAGRGQTLDAAFSGAQQRQSHTLQAVEDIYIKEGLPFPGGSTRENFSEYDAEGMMSRLLPKLIAKDSSLKEKVERGLALKFKGPEGRKYFQEVFGLVFEYWLASNAEEEGIESWKQFQERVIRGIKRIQEEYPSKKTVAVFTSGGPISAALQYALSLNDLTATHLAWVIHNASMTEFKFNRERITLTGFNRIPHLLDPAYITSR